MYDEPEGRLLQPQQPGRAGQRPDTLRGLRDRRGGGRGSDSEMLGLNVFYGLVFNTCMMLCVGINVMTDTLKLFEPFICNRLIIGLTFL